MNDRLKSCTGKMLIPVALALAQITGSGLAQAQESAQSEAHRSGDGPKPADGTPAEAAAAPAAGNGELAVPPIGRGTSLSDAPVEAPGGATPGANSVASAPTASWFDHAPLTLAAGEGAQKFKM